jgi:hypothetical protein
MVAHAGRFAVFIRNIESLRLLTAAEASTRQAETTRRLVQQGAAAAEQTLQESTPVLYRVEPCGATLVLRREGAASATPDGRAAAAFETAPTTGRAA